MKLTELVDEIRIEDDKLTKYLLVISHSDGGSKADFLMRFGFRLEEWRILRQALLKHARENEITDIAEASFGLRYTVTGALTSPDGRHPELRVVWQIQPGTDFAHLITLIPKRGDPK
ncbi:MAG: hypothetical protein L3J67_13420 [Hyphomicrobiaceae bacterium]|nr:hypothetical protein [Hyphomicrobiaceae bacterium]